MRVLLVSMPDAAEVIDYAGRIPTLATVSMAGQLTDHDVRVLDLIVHKPHIRQPLANALREFKPQLVGLTAMTFQFDTLLRIARFVRSTDPSIRLVAGGYHVTLMARELAKDPSLPLDFLVRGEGEATIVELTDALERDGGLDGIAGLSFSNGNGWTHNPDRPLMELDRIRLPNRQARLAQGFHFLGMPIDTIETSRGCPYNCKFCSISHMYGHTFRAFPEERIVEDLRSLKASGTRAVFIVDDNITYDIDHFRRVCRAIVRHGLNDMQYMVQATAAGLAHNPDLVDEMDQANFRAVFVGFESMLQTNLRDMKKPTSPEINRRVAELLRRHGMGIIAGIIAGYPDDTRKSIATNFRLFRQLKPDLIYAQYLTPYPKTVLRDELLAADLVENKDNFSEYDGFTCNVRTRHLSRDELYRLLKREAMRHYLFRPSHLWNNFFLRRYPLPLLRSVGRTFVSDLLNIVTARRFAPKLDI